MNLAPDDREAVMYEIRITRHLDDHWVAWFGDMSLTRENDGTTTLRGLVPDHSALHGVLIKIHDLGMTLISVRTIDRHTEDHPLDHHPLEQGEQK